MFRSSTTSRTRPFLSPIARLAAIRYVLTSTAAVIVAAVAGAGALAAAEPFASAPLRLAIVDVGTQADLPAEFLDLLFVELAAADTIALLEREEIAKVLQEQELSLAMGEGAVSQNAVRVGALAGADALLMLAAEQNHGSVIPIRICVVETKQGIRSAELLADYAPSDGDPRAWFARLKMQLLNEFKRVEQSREGMTFVAVAEFYNRDLTRQSDWLGIALRESVTSRLSRLSDIAILERTEVQTLIAERQLTADLPEALRKAAVVVNGEYELQTAADRIGVDVHVRFVRDEGKEVIERTISGDLNDVRQLQQAITVALQTILNNKSPAPTGDVAAEVDMLLEEGRRYLNAMQFVSARRPLMAAYALDPENVEVLACLMQSAGEGFEGPTRPRRLKGDELIAYRRQVLPWYFFLANVGERLLNYDESLTEQQRPGGGHRLDRAQLGYDILFGALEDATLRSAGDESTQQQRRLFKPIVRGLFQKYLARVSTFDEPYYYEKALGVGIGRGHWWADSPEQALEDRFEYLQQASDLENLDAHGQWALTNGDQYNSLDDVPEWPRQSDWRRHYVQFLERLSASDRPLLRVGAELRWAHYYLRELKDERRALPHFDRFIDLIVTEVLPNHPKMDSCVWKWVSSNAYIHNTGSSALTDAQAGDYYSRVVRAACERAFPRNPQTWSLLIETTILRMQKAGQHEAAYQLLQDCCESLEKHSTSSQRDEVLPVLIGWQEEIAAKHPQVVAKEDDAAENRENRRLISTQVVLDRDSVQEHIVEAGGNVTHLRFRYLVETDGALALICTAGDLHVPVPGERQQLRAQQIAVLRLDPRNFAVNHVSVARGPLLMQVGPVAYDRRFGPEELAIAVDQESIFVASHSAGIVWFRSNAPPVEFSPRHLGAPSPEHAPLAVDSVGPIAIVDKKLYGLAGPNPFDRSLFELDYEQRTSRVIYSPRTAADDHPIRHLRLTSLAAGPSGALLLAGRTEKFIWRPGRGAVPAPFGFFTYHSQTDGYQHLPVSEGINSQSMLTFRGGSLALLFTGAPAPSVGMLDPQRESVEWLLSPDADTPDNPAAIWRSPVKVQNVVYHDGKLIVLGTLPGRQPQWRLFSRGDKESTLLQVQDTRVETMLADVLVTAESKVLAVTPECIISMDVFSGDGT